MAGPAYDKKITADAEMRATLDTNIPNYASAVVTAEQIDDTFFPS